MTEGCMAYVDMIDNMEKDVIKPLKLLLNCKEFRTMEPKQWKLRSENTLKIENAWKLLLQKIKVCTHALLSFFGLIQ